MTDEERKEFEEFQKWKGEKKKEESLKHGEAITPSDDGLQIKNKDSKEEENNAHSDKSVEEKSTEPTLKSKACLKCLYFTKIISALCCYLEYFSYLYTVN